jgi:hypothetical protein
MSHTPTAMQTSAQIAIVQPLLLLDLPQEILDKIYTHCMEDFTVHVHRHDVANDLCIIHDQYSHTPYSLLRVNKKVHKDFLAQLAMSKPLHIEKPSVLVVRNWVDPFIPKTYAENLQTLVISCFEKPAKQAVRVALFPNLKTLLFRGLPAAALRRHLSSHPKALAQGWTKANIDEACIRRVTNRAQAPAEFLLDQLQIRRALSPSCVVKLEMQFGYFEATVLSPVEWLTGPTFTATIRRSAGGNWENEKIEFSKAFETWDAMIGSKEKRVEWDWPMTY